MPSGWVDPLEFAQEDFDELLQTANQSVWWVPSAPCSCFGYYNQEAIRALVPDPQCTQHDEMGNQYQPAVWITGAVVQKMRQHIDYQNQGQQIGGSAELMLFPRQITGEPNPAYLGISDRDLIVAAEVTTTFTDAVPIGQTQLVRPIVRIVSMTYHNTPVDPTQYRVVRGEIEWGPSLLQDGGTVAVSWQYHPVYTLLTAMPAMQIFAEHQWPRVAYLQERTLLGYQLWTALQGKVPEWI